MSCDWPDCGCRVDQYCEPRRGRTSAVAPVIPVGSGAVIAGLWAALGQLDSAYSAYVSACLRGVGTDHARSHLLATRECVNAEFEDAVEAAQGTGHERVIPGHNHDKPGIYGGCPACGTAPAERVIPATDLVTDLRAKLDALNADTDQQYPDSYELGVQRTVATLSAWLDEYTTEAPLANSEPNRQSVSESGEAPSGGER